MISAADQSKWDAIIGPYPILPNENEAHYRAILAAAIDHFGPENLFEYMETREFAELEWERLRLRNFANSRVKSGAESALVELIDGHGNHQWHSASALETAQDYFRGDPKKREQASKKLADRKIDDTAIFAKSFAINIDDIAVLDRMKARRESLKARMLKDRERRLTDREKSRSPGRRKDADQPAPRTLAS